MTVVQPLTSDADVTLSVRNVSKSFNGVSVLSDVSLDIHRGEMVALVGQNGSGKSTFIRILSGFHSPDNGASFFMGGETLANTRGKGASRTGMAFIHQDLPLVESMTILENLRIARFTTGFAGRIRWRSEEASVRKVLRTVGLNVSPHLPVGKLSVTEQALVAIARGLSEIEAEGSLEARLLVLDEPTAYLPEDGVTRLFAVLKELAEDGISILFVSHRLNEVLDNCARVVVFRGGSLVADLPTSGKSERDLIEIMLGQTPESIYPTPNDSVGKTILEVTNLAGAEVRSVDFSGSEGEIVGFVGLPGEGYDQIPYLLAGANSCSSGTAIVDGATVSLQRLTPFEAIKRGVVLLPADRVNASGAVNLSVGENLTLPTVSVYTRLRAVLHHRRERDVISRELKRFAVTPPRSEVPLATLSGGNQQKVLLAKWAIAKPKIFLLHEPTHGVDIGAKREVFAQLNQLAQMGALLIISSVEYEDLANICTRVHVVRDGTIVGTFAGNSLNARDLASAVHQR